MAGAVRDGDGGGVDEEADKGREDPGEGGAEDDEPDHDDRGAGMQANLAGFLEVKKRFIKAPFPAWSMIGVGGLTRPEFLLEVRAVAAYPDGAAR